MDTTIIVAFASCLLGSGGMVQFILSRNDRLNEEKKKEELERQKQESIDKARFEALVNLCCADIQARIVQEAERRIREYNTNGTGITLREKSAIEYMYKYYSELGWNNLAELAIAELNEIPVVD